MDTPRETKILVIDDTLLNIKLIEGFLQREGYLVLTAENGLDGIKIAKEQKPDLILLDIVMPGIDGFQVLEKLKSMSGTAGIPVIMITSVDEIKSKIKCFELGAVDYIVKPFNSLEVKARIGAQLKLSMAYRVLIQNQAEKLKQVQEGQSAMLVQPEQMPEAKFSSYFVSAQEAGGDIYDVIPLAKDTYGYFIGDVSGHDISTSFITASIKALLRQNCAAFIQPVESMRMVNEVLNEILTDGKYITACYVKLSRQRNLMSLVNMGHLPTLILPQDEPAYLVELGGDVLGAFPDVMFGCQEIKLFKGDKFFMFSDGIIESEENQMIWSDGVGRLPALAEKMRDVPIEKAANGLYELAQKEFELSSNEDDKVVLAVQI